MVNRISSERKVRKNVGTSKFEYSEGPLGDVLKTSWGRPESISQGRLDVSIDVSYGPTPYLDYYDTNKIRVKFNGGCLKQDRPTLFHGGKVNFYIVYEVTDNFNVNSYPTPENCFSGAVKLTKNADVDK